MSDFLGLSDDEVILRAAEWIEAACMEHYDGGGPMPSEIEGRKLYCELRRRFAFKEEP